MVGVKCNSSFYPVDTGIVVSEPVHSKDQRVIRSLDYIKNQKFGVLLLDNALEEYHFSGPGPSAINNSDVNRVVWLCARYLMGL